MALFTAVSFSPVPISAMSVPIRGCPPLKYNRLSCNIPIKSSLSPPSSSPRESRSTESIVNSSSASSSSSRPQTDASFDYAFANSAAAAGGNPVFRFVRSTESSIERIIFDFRFLALLAIGGSLAGSLLCF